VTPHRGSDGTIGKSMMGLNQRKCDTEKINVKIDVVMSWLTISLVANVPKNLGAVTLT